MAMVAGAGFLLWMLVFFPRRGWWCGQPVTEFTLLAGRILVAGGLRELAIPQAAVPSF